MAAFNVIYAVKLLFFHAIWLSPVFLIFFLHIKTLLFFLFIFFFKCDLCNGETVLKKIIIFMNSNKAAALRIVVPL